MAVAQFFRNEFTSLELSKRAKAVQRRCARCSAGIDTKGGKRFCSPCYDVQYQEKLKARRKTKP